MTANGWLQIGVFLLIVFAMTPPLGRFINRVFNRERTWLDPILAPVERAIYRVTGVDPGADMPWQEYAMAMLIFSGASMILLYAVLRLQGWLPLNPASMKAVPPDLAFNTAASFTTNTNWQAYSGETTMSYLTQMAGLAYHNFISAAVGLAVAIAFLRGITRREVDGVGNFWVDLVRGLLWVLLPICLVGSLLLVSEGVVQNLRPYDRVSPIDAPEQTIARGPVASQEIVKMLGTNGGGFFNANSAHPFENPTPLSNLIELVAIFAIPSALTFVLGLMTGSRAHGWAVWAAMAFLFFAGVTTTYWSEARGNPILAQAGASQWATAGSPGGNMEGKEVRFGIAASSLFATVTTDASCGAVNGAHESFTPLGGMVPLANIMLGEVIFGGVGAGLYGMLVFIVLTVFIAGLMVGRTPEYLGKSIQAYEVQMAMLAILVFPLTVLVLTGISLVSPGFGLASLLNHGPHGLTEVLYAFTSGTGNNGSAFAGLDVNTPWYNTTIGLATLVGRFFVIVPTLAIAGSLGKKKRVPPSAGTFPVTSPLFAGLLVGVIVIVGALTFFPALSLGPIVEHLLMVEGQVF
jgi:K+-transporting ATPase ATPase A chain